MVVLHCRDLVLRKTYNFVVHLLQVNCRNKWGNTLTHIIRSIPSFFCLLKAAKQNYVKNALSKGQGRNNPTRERVELSIYSYIIIMHSRSS